MSKNNPRNDRIRHQYQTHLREAEGCSEQTIDAALKALTRYEVYNRHRDFGKFRKDHAMGFKAELREQRAQRSGEPLSKATLHSTLNAVKKFYRWLAEQPGHRARLVKTEFDYFGLSRKEVRIATTTHLPRAPTVEQVIAVIHAMPATSEIERRDRALVAFTLLTAARDGAIASIKLKHVNFAENCVYQDGRGVDTKFGKSFPTFLMPVGDEIRDIVVEWISYLRNEKGWGDNDPLFPRTRRVQGKSALFETAGVERGHWATANPIRDIFKKAFNKAGVEYFNPHSLRHALGGWTMRLNPTVEELKAVSQNLGHKNLAVTLLNYCHVPEQRQGELIRGLTARSKP